MRATTRNRLECFCVRKPLLAVFGLDDKLKPYVHVKVYKQRRVYAEFIVREGNIELCCRECFRWHRVVFKEAPNVGAELQEVDIPVEVKQEELYDSASAC